MPGTSYLREDLIYAAAKGNTALEQLLRGLHQHVNYIASSVGVSKTQSPDTPQAPIAAPGCPQFSVSGLDGKFIIVITPLTDTTPKSVRHFRRLRKRHRIVPRLGNRSAVAEDIDADEDIDYGPEDLNDRKSPVSYQLQSATSALFDASSSLSTYGPDPKLVWEIQDPNQAKYWRLRSQFSNSDWSDWCYYVDPILCGVVAVQSSYLRSGSAATNAASNTTNFATVDSVDAGTDTTIRVYGTGGVGSSWTRITGLPGGTLSTTYAAGSVLHQPYSGEFWVFWTGTAYVALSSFAEGMADNFVFVGHVLTVRSVMAGGGGGSTGGGGDSGGGDGGGHLGTG